MSFSVRTPAFRGTMGGAVQDAHTRRVISRREAKMSERDTASVADAPAHCSSLTDSEELASTPLQAASDPPDAGHDAQVERQHEAARGGEAQPACAWAAEDHTLEANRTPEHQQQQPIAQEDVSEVVAEPEPEAPPPEVEQAGALIAEMMEASARHDEVEEAMDAKST